MSRVGAVTGLAYEAACLRRAFGSTPIAIELTGGRPERVGAAVDRLLAGGATAVLSFGMAGGLDPALAPGRIVIAEGIVLPDGRTWPTDREWVSILRRAAVSAGAACGLIAGVDTPVTTPAEKQALHRRSAALAVDMESHAVAVAAEGRAAVAVIRVIVDPASRAVPPAAVAGLREDGGIAVTALLGSLLRRPGQVCGMIALARDAAAARPALRRAAALAAAATPAVLPRG